MDGSQVIENLDSLWFYTNIITCSDETELTEVPSLTQASIDSPKREECESQKNVLCHKCGEEVKGNVSEVVRKSGKGKEKRERRMRKKRNEAEVIIGELDLGFDVNGGNRFLSVTQLPPIDDDVAMKKHLKSWAYAVACTVK